MNAVVTSCAKEFHATPGKVIDGHPAISTSISFLRKASCGLGPCTGKVFHVRPSQESEVTYFLAIQYFEVGFGDVVPEAVPLQIPPTSLLFHVGVLFQMQAKGTYLSGIHRVPLHVYEMPGCAEFERGRGR